MAFNTERERESFESGESCMLYYIAFCRAFYAFEFNLAGVLEFILDIDKFLLRENNKIPNHFDVSFPQFRDAYIKCYIDKKEDISLREMWEKYLLP